MKRLNTLLAFFTLTLFSTAQTRVSLLEEFTGETCMPCAAYNPALDYLIKQPANASKLIAIKWEVPIPVAPTNSFSLYQTNLAEINWRYKGAAVGGYGYPSQYTPTSTVNDGIINAPTCFIDGKNQWAFGALGDHPYYLKNSVINTAAAVLTPFSITMSPAWNSNFTNCVVTVTVASSTAFTAQGSLMFRLCLVERKIEFATAPGYNGETTFYDAVRKSYPVTTSGSAVTNMGTVLPSTWTAGQTQVFTINCIIPSYIMDRSQMAFVGFVQDDGDRQVYQTARTAAASVPNDAKAEAVDIPLVVCSSMFLPSAIIKNNGPTAITALTITPLLNGNPGTNVIWNGNLASLSTVTIPLNPVSAPTGTQLCGFTIAAVSGGDMIQENNQKQTPVLVMPTYTTAPTSEGFESSTLPPLNWSLSNLGAASTFSLSPPTGAYGLSYNSLFYPLAMAPIGEEVDLYLPPTDLVGTINSELSFDLAYQQSGSSKDSLKVLLSSDCGTSWSTIFLRGGSSMTTAPAPVGNSGFTPASTDWTTHVTPLVSYAGSPHVLIKFRVKGDGGNGLYLDNVNLKAGAGNPTNTTGIVYLSKNEQTFTLYPNPANTYLAIKSDNVTSGQIKIEVENTMGQIIYSETNSSQTNIDCRNFPIGVYYVKVKNGTSAGVKKLVISR